MPEAAGKSNETSEVGEAWHSVQPGSRDTEV